MFQINEKLQKTILQDLPANASNLKKALIIYNKLCQTLNYSMEFYLDCDGYENWFQDIDNLKYIDGDNNKDICCFTFNAILMKILLDANIINKSAIKYNPEMLLNKQYLNSMHNKLFLPIDGSIFSVDATVGILDNNDLILSKYSSHKINGWKVLNENNHKSQLDLNNALNEINNNHKKPNFPHIEQILSKCEEYKTLPLEKRFSIFLVLSKFAPEYSILSFNYLLKLKRLLFTDKELKSSKDQIRQFVDLQFVLDKHSGEFKAIAMLNPKGYVNDKGYENFDNLTIYELSIKNRTISQISKDNLKNKIISSLYTSNHGWPISIPMIMAGKLHTFSNYDSDKSLRQGNPIDWEMQSKHNKRKILTSGEIIDWDEDTRK